MDQSIKDISRFCTFNSPCNYFSPLSADDTYNIGSHYLVQTVYRNLSIVDRETLKSPWFQGPCSLVRSTTEDEHRLLWQAAKRADKSLKDLRVLGTDDDKAIYNAILGECDILTSHILGLEHVKKNISEKLTKDFHFPQHQANIIMDDIFKTLYNCEKKNYDQIVTSMKEKWSRIEAKFTINRGENTFVNYFEKNKQTTFKNKLIKSAREMAHLKSDYWQNPVEWSNHLVKDELRALHGSERTVAVTEIVQAMKKRNIRVYTNVCKAIRNTGPYKLSTPFSHFEVSHNDWFSMTREQQENHLQEFFSFIPGEGDIIDEVDEVRNDTVSNPMQGTSTNDQSTSQGTPTYDQSTNQETDNRKRIPISHHELNLGGMIPDETLDNMFHEAENLLNTPDGVTTAASNDDRLRTVKNSNSNYPLIVAPNKKNRNLLECKCKTYTWYNLCAHTVAAACDINMTFDYFVEVKKKLSSKGKKRGLTSSITANLSSKEMGMKPDEIARKNNQKKKKNDQPMQVVNMTSPQQSNFSQPINQSSTMTHPQHTSSSQQPSQSATLTRPLQMNLPMTSQQQINLQQALPTATMIHHQTMNHPLPTIHTTTTPRNQLINYSNAEAPNYNLQYFMNRYPNPLLAQIPTNSNTTQQPVYQTTQHWNASMSPHPYILIPLPPNVQKCYGCGQRFADCYRQFPRNFVVRHRDRRIIGMDGNGQPVLNKNFQFTYYHLKRDHIVRKNPLFMNNPVVFVPPDVYQILSDDPVCESFRASLDVILEIAPGCDAVIDP